MTKHNHISHLSMRVRQKRYRSSIYHNLIAKHVAVFRNGMNRKQIHRKIFQKYVYELFKGRFQRENIEELNIIFSKKKNGKNLIAF